jgi:hypothetical protein
MSLIVSCFDSTYSFFGGVETESGGDVIGSVQKGLCDSVDVGECRLNDELHKL